jgi:hypothetical protein
MYWSSISCGSTLRCEVVGANEVPDGSLIVAELDGEAMVVQNAPQPEGAKASVLNGVSCPSPDFCLAVGEFSRNGYTFAPLVETIGAD